MTQAHALWSAAKQQELSDQLTGFWAGDLWNMNECPLNPEDTKGLNRFIFNCLSPSVNTELKYAVWKKYEKGDWNPAYPAITTHVHRIIKFLNEEQPRLQSFLVKPLSQWEILLSTYMLKHDLWKGYERSWTNSRRVTKKTIKGDNVRVYLRQIYKILEKAYDWRDEHEKDIWDLHALGFSTEETRSHNQLNFTNIHQPWLRQVVKRFIRFKLAKCEPGTCLAKITALNHFSKFIKEKHPQLQPQVLSREIIEEFISYEISLGLCASARAATLGHVRQFLELSVREHWAPFPEKSLIYDEDFPKLDDLAPRFIPQDVLDQIMAHLDDVDLTEWLATLFRIGLHTGARADDLIAIKKDCLIQDSEGDYFVKFFIRKMKRDHFLPLDRELAEVIHTQQQRVTEEWGDSCDLLFPNRKGKAYSQVHTTRLINDFIIRKNIKRLDGSLYRFQLHSLRHTCGTQMINGGYPHHLVQEWLAHESAEMTNRYAHIYSETKKKAFQKYREERGPLINIKGAVVNLDADVDGVANQLLKEQINDSRLALGNGHCTYPIARGNCPHFHACYQCVHFVTEKKFLETHEADLKDVEEDLVVARQKNQIRRVEKLEQDRSSLRSIIDRLKKEGVIIEQATA